MAGHLPKDSSMLSAVEDCRVDEFRNQTGYTVVISSLSSRSLCLEGAGYRLGRSFRPSA
jgi:hypothetical protein